MSSNVKHEKMTNLIGKMRKILHNAVYWATPFDIFFINLNF